MREEFKGKNLYEKINYIQTALYDIEKKGKNAFQKYTYKRFTDIKQSFNSLLRDTGIVFLPTNKHLTVAEMDFKWGYLKQINTQMRYTIPEVQGQYANQHQPEKQVEQQETGHKGTFVTYTQEYALINSESPSDYHTFYFPMPATHNDEIDKASGSAVTYGLKYLFNLWGLIPDEALDPDFDDREQVVEQENKVVAPPKQVKPTTIPPKAPTNVAPVKQEVVNEQNSNTIVEDNTLDPVLAQGFVNDLLKERAQGMFGKWNLMATQVRPIFDTLNKDKDEEHKIKLTPETLIEIFVEQGKQFFDKVVALTNIIV